MKFHLIVGHSKIPLGSDQEHNSENFLQQFGSLLGGYEAHKKRVQGKIKTFILQEILTVVSYLLFAFLSKTFIQKTCYIVSGLHIWQIV